ncbi:hypothetical protein ACFLSA_03580 [Bacteroidota bacterium]
MKKPGTKKTSSSHINLFYKVFPLKRRVVYKLTMLFISSLIIYSCTGFDYGDEDAIESPYKKDPKLNWKSSLLKLPAIDAPKEKTAPLTACYRKDLVLPVTPRSARISFFIKNTPYWISINGVTVSQPQEESLQLKGLKNIDITSNLHEGHNVIVFKSICTEPDQSWFSAEGIVFCEDGSTLRILTDNWKGGWNLPEGWKNPAFMPEGWQLVKSANESIQENEGYHINALTVDAKLRPHANFEIRLPYYGPIQVQPVVYPTGEYMDQPIFDEENHVMLEVLLMNMQKEGIDSIELQAAVFDETSQRTTGSEQITLSPQGALDLKGSLDLGKLSKGAYEIRFILKKNGKELASRNYEIVNVGKIEQRLVDGTHYEEGLDLKEVWNIDCTAEPGEGEFVATHTDWNTGEEWREVETKVVDGPAGRYRVLGDKRDRLYFAYTYQLKNLYVPHLAVVEWPDDAHRDFIVQIKEPGSGSPYFNDRHAAFQRSETSWIMDHDRFPERSNKLKKLHLLFWPNSRIGSIYICNVDGGKEPAAAASITFYEITNGLPALRIKDAGDHLIGPHTERGNFTLASTYYSGKLGTHFVKNLGLLDHPGFYHNWYVTTENLIKCMRFSGQNLYLSGHFMYNSTLYASELDDWGYSQNSYLGGDVIRDNTGLILRMFEQNGIAMVSGVEHFNVPVLTDIQPTPEEIRAGIEHKFMVTREGTLFPVHAVRYANGGWTGSGRPLPDGTVPWPAPNYFHPDIQERFMAIIDDLAEKYGKYNAWKGIAFFLSRCMGPMEVAHLRSSNTLQAGYEDYTIDLFEKETGIQIPVNKLDPDRFEKRYQWIKKNIEEQWINWRCSKYTDFYRRIRNRISGGRPDIKLYLIIGEPMLWKGSQEILDGHYDDSTFLVNLLKRFGFDLPKLQNEPGIVLTSTYALAGSGEARYTGDHQGWRELTQNQMWQSFFADNAIGGAFIKSGLQHYGRYTFPEDFWIFSELGTHQGWLYSTYVTETFVNVMSRSNPTWMPHTWMDICESMGRIQEKRIFARAYRCLPNAKYERLAGNGLDKNIWISQTKTKGVRYAYASNLHWWKPYVTLQFGKNTEVYDLIDNKPVKLENGAWKFRMKPYSIQTFRISGGDIQSAGVEIDEADRKHIESEIRQVLSETEKIISEARKRKSEFAGQQGWESLKELELRTEQARARFETGDLAEAYTLITGALPIAQDKIRRILKGEKIVPLYL